MKIKYDFHPIDFNTPTLYIVFGGTFFVKCTITV